MRVEVYERTDGLFDWRLVADNGEIMISSAQGYTERNDAHEAFQKVQGFLSGAGSFVAIDVDQQGAQIGGSGDITDYITKTDGDDGPA